MYVEYLKDFLFTVEVDDATKDITFSLSLFENQLTFTRFDFLSAIGLADSNIVVPLPPKGTVRAGLATLGLTDKDKPFLSSIELVNSSPLKIKYFSPIWKIFMQYIVKCLGGMQRSHNQMNLSQQTIAYCLIFGLEINIGEIIFNDLIYKIQNRKKNRETNICYTRFISLVLEQILGDNYQDESLTVLKPHHISAASFQIPSASEVSLTSHMLKVAKLSKEPEESLILPSEEVNAEATADKSQSRTNVQPLSQPKAPTAKKPRKEKIPSSTQPKMDVDVKYDGIDIDLEIQADIDECIAYVDALRVKGIDARVIVEVVDREETETEVTYETLGDLVQRFHDHTKEISAHRVQAIKSVQRDQGHRIRVTRSQRRELRVQREMRQIRRFRFYDRMRIARLEACARRHLGYRALGARDAARNLKPLIGGGGEQEEISGNGNGNVNGGGNGYNFGGFMYNNTQFSLM
ncbi:retrovirus-related pol polyprotein from transposon TNT 1-94 [Tanacetum coccineum]